MRLNQIPEVAVQRLFGRLIARAIGAVLFALFALVAIYHFTVAGTLALESEYGLLYARLIVAAAFSAAALIVLIVLWVTRIKPAIEERRADILITPRDTQIAALIEAALLGYTMARRSADRGR